MYITKGVASVRGDTIPFLKRIYEDVKVKILAKISFEEIHEIITRYFRDLLDGRIDRLELV